MATLEIEGKRIEVDDSFLSLSPEQQAATVDEIAQSLQLKPAGGSEFLGQFNRRMSQGLDFMNAPRRLVGNAINDLRGAPRAETATEIATDLGAASSNDPTTIAGKAGKGGADALLAFAPVMGALGQLKSLGGVTGAIADDAIAALATKWGLTTEVAAGAMSGGAQKAAEDAGYGEMGQSLAGLAAPLSIPAMGATARGVVNVADAVTDITPGVRYAKDVARGIKQAVVPMTDAGATEVARTRVQQLAGGEERAARLGAKINPADDLGRTGPEQTADPNLIGLQNSVRKEYPEVGERLDARRATTEKTIVESVRDMGGDIGDARMFFRQRLSGFKRALSERVNSVMGRADAKIDAAGPQRGEASNSLDMVGKLKASLDDALSEEAGLWAAVPQGATVSTAESMAAAKQMKAALPRAQEADMPRVVQRLLLSDGGFSGEETVSEMHGLYSELRRVARSAMAGNDQNKNLARIANNVADAILRDLGTLDPESKVGRAVNEARAFSRAMHETFDRGAVGRILKRTLDGDEVISPETALDKTVGRGGSAAMADDQSLRAAAFSSGENVSDYLRGRFSEAIVNASGEFTPKVAQTWLRNNAEVLARYPGMAGELRRALSSREAAAAFSIRAAERSKLSGSVGDFLNGQPEGAVKAILGADDPIKAARSVAATARKDTSGKALAGVKGAFTSYLTEDPKRLFAFIEDSRTREAMARVFSPEEMRRLTRLATASKDLATRGADVGEVIDAPANQLVEVVVRMAGAKAASKLHQGSDAGVSLQAAQLGASRASRWLKNLTNDKARQILVDAVEDPALMRALLMDANAPEMPKWARSKLAPYLTGAVAADQ